MVRISVSIPDIIQVLYLITLPIMAVIGFIYCVCSFITASKWIAVGAIIVSWLLLIGIGLIIKGSLLCLFKKFKTSELTECKVSLSIGWIGCLAFGWFPRIFVFFVYQIGKDYYLELLWYIIFVSLGGISLFWTLFVAEYKKKCQVTYQPKEKLQWILLFINCVVLLATVKLGLINFFTEPIVKTQLGLSIICAACSIELGQVLRGKVKLHDEGIFEVSQNPGQESVLVQRANSEVEPFLMSQKFECKICLSEFSATKIPRIIKECGHTVCEECANTLLKANNGQHLFCPFCQKVTLVNGPANLLPKNFTILDIIEERAKGK